MTVRPWLVWSNERGGFWRANRHGYTHLLGEAGRFTDDEAHAIVQDANLTCPPDEPNEVMVLAPADGLYAATDTRPLLAAAGRAVQGCFGLTADPIAWDRLFVGLAAPSALARAVALRTLASVATAAADVIEDRESERT